MRIVREVKKSTRRRKSKYNDFAKMMDNGLNKDEIIEKLDIAKQTYSNYKVRWKRERAARFSLIFFCLKMNFYF